jgi:hypothetical protein
VGTLTVPHGLECLKNSELQLFVSLVQALLVKFKEMFFVVLRVSKPLLSSLNR